MNTPFKEDLDNLFRPMYDEYFEKKSFNMPINFDAQQVHNHEDSSSTFLIDIEAHEAPPIVTTSEEQNSPISLNKADEFYQEDSAELDGNTLLTLYDAPNFSEAKSSTHLDPSNMHEFHQVQPSTHIWRKAYPLKQVISDPSIYVMTRHRLQTDHEVFARLEVVRIFIAFVAHKNITIFQMDVKTAFISWALKRGCIMLFLGLQVHQSPRGIFISQLQYAIELLKKHGMDECVSMSTPMATKRLDADLQGTLTDQTTYHRMIRGLMYLIASRPDIALPPLFVLVIKHVLRSNTSKRLNGSFDADHAGCKDDCKRTSGDIQFLEHVEKGMVELYFVGIEYQLADLFTKALPKERFEYLVHRIVIIMAQPQRPADVHQDELCLPNKRYALMDANKKVDLENPTIFHLPQATDNNHDHFVPALNFSEMVPFYINNLGFTLELRSTSNFEQPVFYNRGRHSARWKSKNVVGMKIPDWMITEEMKPTKNYRLYADVFGVDVPTTQSQPIESTHGTHRKTSAPRTHNPEIAEGESSAPQSHEELEAKQNVEKVKEHLMAEEIKKLVEGLENVEENVEVASSPLRNDDNQTNPGTRLEPRSDKESLEVEKIANISQPMNMVDERIKKILQTQVPSQVDSSARSYMSGHLQHDDLPIWLALKYKFETLHMATTPCRPSAVLPTDQDNPYDAHLEGEKCTKRLKTSEHRTFVFRESSSGQDYESEPGPSTSGNHDQYDDFDFWINSYVSNDDVLPNEKVSQELMDEMSQTVDEAKLRKVIDEMLRQQCTSGDEHQYHIDQMQNFLKSDIVWESKKEIIVPPYQPKPTLVIHSCQRDPKAPALSLVNQDLLYLKKGNKGPEKIAISPYTSIEKYKVFSIYSEPVYGIIYKNNKKEKRVMRHQEVHKFCDATLKRVLEGLKSYNNDVKYGYVTHNLSKEDVEYLQLFAEEIEERLKYHGQMTRWEIYVNGRLLGSRRERLK
ncbi:hypothetical protein Tco_0121272 [Tanacetum coccineum]